MQAGTRSLSVAALVVALSSVAMASAPAQSFRLEKKFDLAAGDRFVLASAVGGVVLRGVEGRQASIVVTSDREDLGDRFEFRFEQAGGQLKMIVEAREKGLLSWFQQFRGRVHIAVEVPRRTPVDVRTSGGAIDLSAIEAAVQASSSGGAVKATDVRGDVRLTSSGGGVRAESIRGSVFAQSSGGSVVLAAVSGDVDASSSGGGVDVQEAGGRVKADSSGGPVRVVFAAGNAKGGDLQSSGGGIVASIDPAAGIDVNATASGGSVTCDLPVTVQGRLSRGSLQGTLHGGGALLLIRSSGGGVTIKAAAAR